MAINTFKTVWPGEFIKRFGLPANADVLDLVPGAVAAWADHFESRRITGGTVHLSMLSAKHLALVSSDAGARVVKVPLPRIGDIPELAFTGGILVEERGGEKSLRVVPLVVAADCSRLPSPSPPRPPSRRRRAQRGRSR